jgi:hypothetical protein
MALVATVRAPGAVNLYDECDSMAAGDPAGLATARRHALRRYLNSRWHAPVVLVGEAPGRNGARWTGVPFSSPRQLTGSGPAEATATVVHPPGNRDPRRQELDVCAPVLERVCRGRFVVAVGRHAQVATGARYVRHPSHGGAARFAEGLAQAFDAARRPGCAQ